MSFRMVFDSGSKAFKCAIADADHQILAIETLNPEVIQSEDGFERIFNRVTLWDEVKKLAKQTIAVANIDPKEIRYITSCSIRPSTVFVDEDNNPLYIATSFNTRGIDVADDLDRKLKEVSGQSFYQITGHSPLLLFSPAQYGAFVENQKNNDNPEKIAQYLPMDSFILMKFGAESHANYTSAAESGFFDLKAKFWAEVWSKIFDLPDFFFPIPVQSGEVVGYANEEVQQELGLSSECELIAGLPDSQAALLGLNCVTPGSFAAIMGSTTPVQGVSKTLHLDPQEKGWMGLFVCKNICDCYITEANMGVSGQIVRWAANTFAAQDGSSIDDRYSKLGELYQEFDQIEQQGSLIDIQNKSIYALLGPGPLASSSTAILPGQFIFPTPGSVEEIETPLTSFVGALYDNIEFGLANNIEIVCNWLKITQPKYVITGGITRNLTLNQRFADLFQKPVWIASNPESTIQGLLLLCDIAEGKIQSTADIQKVIESEQILTEYTPRPDMGEKLHTKYQNWQKLFKKYSA